MNDPVIAAAMRMRALQQAKAKLTSDNTRPIFWCRAEDREAFEEALGGTVEELAARGVTLVVCDESDPEVDDE